MPDKRWKRSLGIVVQYTVRVRGVCGRALELPSVGEGCAMKEPMITGRQPDSRNSTVRDERGACGNVGYGMG